MNDRNKKWYAACLSWLSIASMILVFFVFGYMLCYFYQVNLKNIPIARCGVKDPTPVLMKVNSDFDYSKYEKGKKLFAENCASCHAKNMKTDLTGPALATWRDYIVDENEFLIYVNNPDAYLAITKNEKLKALAKEWDPTIMNPFPELDLEDVRAIITYIGD